MRKVILFLMLCACLASQAQQLKVKSVGLRPGDTRASTNPREDGKGEKCAIIRVAVVGVPGLKFPEAVGNVKYELNEYEVYVPDGLKKLKYQDKNGNDLGTINFDDFGIEINSKLSYDVSLESESHLRAAIFTNLPSNAKLKVDGQTIEVTKEGSAMVNKPVGVYNYQVEADGFRSEYGLVSLTEEAISTTINVVLEERRHKVTIFHTPHEASVFVDNVPYSIVNGKSLDLTEGKHTIRVTAPYYEEKEMTIDVKNDMSESINLKKAKQESVKYKEERTRTSINVRNAQYFSFSGLMMGVSEIDKIINKENAVDLGFETSWVGHFAGIMGLRAGIGIGFILPQENEKYIGLAYNSENDSLEWLMHVDVPLQIGFSLPFGKYNQHMFNVFGGGYGSYIWRSGIRNKEVEPGSELQERIAKHEEMDKDKKIDYGIRVSAKIDIGRFVLGADLSQSLNGMGILAGINLGWKIYFHKKD